MKTRALALGLMWISLLSTTAPETAEAALGKSPSESAGEAGVEVMVLPSHRCPGRGKLCLSGDGSSTRVVDSRVATVLGQRKAEPRFVRSRAQLVGTERRLNNDQLGPWRLELNATLRRPALRGNTVFAIYDAENRRSLSSRKVIAVYQAPVAGGSRLAARLTLSPEDGFLPAHTYRIRVAQIIKGKERVMAEGTARLQ